MNREEVRRRIRDIGIIPAIRVASIEDARFAIEAVADGGIPIVEVTMTVPNAVELISRFEHHQDTVVGAGTVLDVDVARRCLDAGADFITAPGFDPEIVEFVAKRNVAVLPGALTPTEIVLAWKAGADFVKVFPCSQVGGEKYIKAVKTALPHIPLIASGGVNQVTAASLIVAGAEALGVGKELIPADAIEHRRSDRIRELARRFILYVKEGRERLGYETPSHSEDS